MRLSEKPLKIIGAALPFMGLALGAAFFIGEICSYLFFLLDLSRLSIFPNVSKNHLNLAAFFLSSWLMLYSELHRKNDKRRLGLLAAAFIGVSAWYLTRVRYGENAFTLGGCYFYFPFQPFSQILFYLDAALALRISVGIWNEVIFPKAKHWYAERRSKAFVGVLANEKVWLVALHVALATISMSLYLKAPTRIISAQGMDALQMVWNLWWFKESLWRGTNPFFCDAIYVHTRIPVALTFHTYIPLWGLFSVPFQVLMRNPAGAIFAYNLAQWLSIVIAGMGSYYLAGLACRRPAARVVASLIGPYYILPHISRYTLNYGFTGLIPFQFAFLVLGLNKDHRKFKWAAALMALQVYGDLTYASHMALFALMAVCFFSIARRKWPVPLKETAMATALFLIVLAPFLYSLTQVDLRSVAQFKQHPAQVYGGSADPLSLLGRDGGRVLSNITAFPMILRDQYHSHFYTSRPFDKRDYYDPHDYRQPACQPIFIGIMPFLLAAIGIWKRRSPEGLFWMISAAVFFVLSLGPRLIWAGEVVNQVVLPYAFLQHVPFLALGKNPVFQLVPFLYCLLFFIAPGADALLETKKVTVAGLLLLTCLDQFKMTRQGFEPGFPKHCEFLAAQTGDFSVIDVPMVLSVPVREHYMYFQVLHQKDIWAAYVARYFPARQTEVNTKPPLSSTAVPDIISFHNANPEIRARYMVIHNWKESDHVEASEEFGPIVYRDDQVLIREYDKQAAKPHIIANQ